MRLRKEDTEAASDRIRYDDANSGNAIMRRVRSQCERRNWQTYRDLGSSDRKGHGSSTLPVRTMEKLLTTKKPMTKSGLDFFYL